MLELTLIQKICVWALPVVFAITLHEVAHGWVASKFGDQTARLQGRLTINPLSHVDLVGTIIVPLFMLLASNFIFGWAKPVPVDMRNMRNPRMNMAVTALAGPLANLLMAIFWGGVAKMGMMSAQSHHAWLGLPLFYMGNAGMMINVVLGVLNLIPLPPLDGGNVLMNVLPPKMAYQLSFIQPYSFFILVLLLVSGVLSNIMAPIVLLFLRVLASVYGLESY